MLRAVSRTRNFISLVNMYAIRATGIVLFLLFCALIAYSQTTFAATNSVSSAEKTEVSSEILIQLMEDARQAMLEHQYNRAIKFYTTLVEMPDHILRRDAIESLGLAYERAGKLDDAKKTYEYYLQQYPKSNGTERVQQRIAGLVTATWSKKSNTKTKRTTQTKANWRHYGMWSQHLRRNASIYENDDEIVNLNILTSSLDANSRGRTGSLDIKTRFTGSYNNDLENSNENYEQLSYLYADINQRSVGVHTRIGRQRADGGGVLGRFDGATLGYRINPVFSINMVGGKPVERTTNVYIDNTRQFYGLNLQTGPWHKNWYGNTYYIRQSSETFIDREAAGFELRYLHAKRSLYSIIDYDLHFDALNIFSTQLNWTASEKTDYHFFLDYRHSPSFSTRNALIGQTTQSLEDLNKQYSDDEIHQLAIDRTTEYYMAMAAVSHTFNPHYRWDTDLTVSNLVASPASGGVPANPGTPNEYYVSTRLTVKQLFMDNDVNIFGLRYADTTNSTQLSLTLNSRLRTTPSWFIYPRLLLERRKYTNNAKQEENKVAPGIRIEYKPRRYFSVDLEVLPEWTTRDGAEDIDEYRNYYVSLGYRLIFN